MRKIIIILFLVSKALNSLGQDTRPFANTLNKVKGETLIIKPSSTYTLNQRILSSKGYEKKCLLFNIISDYHTKKSVGIGKILIVIKVFIENTLENALIRINFDTLKGTLGIDDLISVAYKSVTSHLSLGISTMTQIVGNEATVTNFSIILEKDNTYYQVKGNVLCQFFNLLDFEQATLLQSNLTIINRLAIMDSTKYSQLDNGTDSIATSPASFINNPKVDLQGKIYLAKKNKNNSFKFYRRHFICSDCPFHSIEEFDYLPGVGIVSFISKIPVWTPLGELIDSEKYYRYREE